MQVLSNVDELFEREELSAAPDPGWPDCFNSGVFVFRPSNDTYEQLVTFCAENGSFDGERLDMTFVHSSHFCTCTVFWLAESRKLNNKNTMQGWTSLIYICEEASDYVYKRKIIGICTLKTHDKWKNLEVGIW